MRRGGLKGSRSKRGKNETTPAPTAPTGLADSTVANGPQLPLVGSPPSALKDLPALRDAPPGKREALFIQKLQLCGVIFSFDDPTVDKRGKVSGRRREGAR